MTHYIFSAFMLGLIGGIIPGPVLTATFTEILQSGFFKSMRIILWAMLVETLIAIMSLILFSFLHLPESVFRVISLGGAGILVWISFSIWKVKKIDTDEKVHFSPWKIAAMILSNGMLWTFWITVCIPKAIALNEKILFGNYLFLLLVEAGWLISTVAVAIVFAQFRKLLSNPKVVPLIFKIFALVFLYFAAETAYKSIRFFIS